MITFEVLNKEYCQFHFRSQAKATIGFTYENASTGNSDKDDEDSDSDSDSVLSDIGKNKK